MSDTLEQYVGDTIHVTYTGRPFYPIVLRPIGRSVILQPVTSGSQVSLEPANGVGVEELKYLETNVMPDKLLTISFDDLGFIAGQLSMLSPSTTSIAFPALKTIGGDCNNNGGTGLVSFTMPLLQYIGGEFKPPIGLTSFSLPSLIGTGNNFSLIQSPATLTTFSAPLLAYTGLSCGNSHSINSNVLAGAMSFPSIKYVGGAFGVTSNSMTSISAPLLVYAGSIAISSTAITSIDLSSLQETDLGCVFGSSLSSLTSLSLPAIVNLKTTSGAALQVTGGTSLTTFTLGSTLKSIVGNVVLTGNAFSAATVNAILARLVALDGTNGTTLYGASGSRTVNLSGGTSAAPTGQGITDKATLNARASLVVTTN